MTSGLVLLFLAMATASMAIVLMVRELHLRALNTRASNVVTGVSERPAARFKEVTGWLSSIGMRYRRFYSAEDLEQLRAVIQSSGFNPHRALPIWIGGHSGPALRRVALLGDGWIPLGLRPQTLLERAPVRFWQGVAALLALALLASLWRR